MFPIVTDKPNTLSCRKPGVWLGSKLGSNGFAFCFHSSARHRLARMSYRCPPECSPDHRVAGSKINLDRKHRILEHFSENRHRFSVKMQPKNSRANFQFNSIGTHLSSIVKRHCETSNLIPLTLFGRRHQSINSRKAESATFSAEITLTRNIDR
jgi:hypothetical protein